MAATPSRRGFTLIEILVVVTIIIMAFGFATPTISKFLANKKIKSVASRVARGLQAGRMRAITKHYDVYLFFLRDRMMIVSARAEAPEFFSYFNNEGEKAKMGIYLRFADASTKHDPRPEGGNDQLASDLPSLPGDQDWTRPLPAKALLQGGLLEGKLVYLLFKSEGTVEFGSADGPGDILPMGFWQTPPIDADVIIQEVGNASHGWIDIRPTGNVDLRIADGTPDLGGRKASAGEAERS
jgi:prepilin-type N-terminal cleavage/methylation domain-containing protein